MSKLIGDVTKAIEPVLNKIGFELVDVEFNKKHGQDNLTVFVWLKGGVTLDDCERAHYAVSAVLDELDPIDGPYILNVSSPGLDRPFKTQRDFERNLGLDVEVKLYAPMKGKKIIEGVLTGRDENCITLQIRSGADKARVKDAVKDRADDSDNAAVNDEIKIENTKIAYVRPLVKFC